MSILLKTGNTYTSVLTTKDLGGGWKQLVPLNPAPVSANTGGTGSSKNNKKDD